jgi:PIN domain nuclease of toxin-antitoxin system
MSSLLLDTHTFIWLSEDDQNLPATLQTTIENTDRVFVSIVSFWEISIKLNIGKISLKDDFNSIETRFLETKFILLPISISDTIQLSQLPIHHKDPFDRILISQAINRTLPIASRDVAFDAYDVQRLWA